MNRAFANAFHAARLSSSIISAQVVIRPDARNRALPSCTVLDSAAVITPPTIGCMLNVTLYEFVRANRDELIRRCRAKVAKRSAPPPTEAEIEHGVPLFLNQLCAELRPGPSKTREIRKSAGAHGHELLLQGFTISQVVHDYGDVCQSITDLAVQLEAPISTDDFRTLNRCLDDAIAGAVTEYAHGQDVTRDGESHQLRNFTNTAITAFEVIKSGNVGVGGSTGAVLYRNLMAMRDALIDRPLAEEPEREQAAKDPIPTRVSSSTHGSRRAGR
jgi:hypothetical protein